MVIFNRSISNAADFRDLQVGTPVRHFYYTHQWQRIEERHELNGDLSLHAQWLPGARYIDDHVLRDVVSTPGNSGVDPDERKYYLSDANWNTVAVVGKTSTGPDVWGVQERYAYQPYGMPIYLNPDFSTKTTQQSSYAVENLFQGLALSPRVSLYPGRYRVLQPALGKWTTRDPLGYPDGLNSYAAYHLLMGDTDPYGLSSQQSACDRFYKWLYTGDPEASDEVYHAALAAAGDLLNVLPVRGFYVGSHIGTNYPGTNVGVGGSVSWTIDSGFQAGAYGGGEYGGIAVGAGTSGVAGASSQSYNQGSSGVTIGADVTQGGSGTFILGFGTDLMKPGSSSVGGYSIGIIVDLPTPNHPRWNNLIREWRDLLGFSCPPPQPKCPGNPGPTNPGPANPNPFGVGDTFNRVLASG